MILGGLHCKIMEKLITNEPGVTGEVRAAPQLGRREPGLHSGPRRGLSAQVSCPYTQEGGRAGKISLLGPWGGAGRGTWPPLCRPCSFGKRRRLKINPQKGKENEDRQGERGGGGSS